LSHRPDHKLLCDLLIHEPGACPENKIVLGENS
jgi:hypothetical protein